MKRYAFLLINLYAFVFCTFAGQGESILMKIGSREVSRSEFEFMYQKHCSTSKNKRETLNGYLELFVNQKLKVLEAEACGYDTLQSFQNEFSDFCNDLKEIHDSQNNMPYNVCEPFGDEVQVAHIFKYLPQDASGKQLAKVTMLMDSIYLALQHGADFAELAKKYSDDKATADKGGITSWFSVNRKVKEFEINAFANLSIGSYTSPFFTPEGCHILKLLGRRQVQRKQNSDISIYSLQMQEYRDAILSTIVENNMLTTNKQGLSIDAFFEKNKSDYKWDKARFSGIIFYAKEKKQIKTIKKLLKKVPQEEWLIKLEETKKKNKDFDILFSGTLFSEGDDANVDKVIFKKGELMPKVGYPYMGTLGKKVKAPDIYTDVLDLVIPDYKKYLETSWINKLRDKYKVEINQEVLKTVNNH